jgi:DNA-binding NarL/FixJ family response regulator
MVHESPSIRVLVVTLFEDDDSVFMALKAGARGYVLKDADEEELVRAIRAVGRGEAIFSPAVAERMLAYFAGSPLAAAPPLAFPTLTDREREILNLIARIPEPLYRKGTVAEYQDGRQLRLQYLY